MRCGLQLQIAPGDREIEIAGKGPLDVAGPCP